MCPNCNHPNAEHSNLAGCLVCTCSRKPGRAAAQRAADQAATTVALERVEGAASPGWIASANDAVETLARMGQPFTPDDVWDLLDDRGVHPPREPRALGPVLKGAAKAGTIRVEGTASSRRRHGALIRSYIGSRA